MVTILSAFLGFVLGVQPVELSVMGDVAAVELQLDDLTVATLTGPPWIVAVDFGDELAPHELLAIARDREGQEIWRALRRINVPQARSQVEVVLRPAAEPGAAARAGIVWRSVDGDRPDEWRVALDGTEIEVSDPGDFALPAYDAAEPHVLEAALRFGRSVARGELVFGGGSTDSVSSDLTALVYERTTDKPPSADEMAGWLSARGEPLEVVAVEVGGADIVAVHEATPRAWGSLSKLRRQILESTDRNPLKKRLSSGLNHDDRLRVILPVGEPGRGGVTKFHMSADFSSVEYGATTSGVGRQQIAGARAYGFLASFPYPLEAPLREDAPRRTADAIAVAAQVAAAANRARAVVLIREVGTDDGSELAPETVRRYLDRLQVPLFVWSVGKMGKDASWGSDESVGSPEKFLRVSLALREALDRQTVVWVRGRHLAHEIELSDAARRRIQPATTGTYEVSPEAESDFLPWISARADDGPGAAEAAPLEPRAETGAAVVTAVASSGAPSSATPGVETRPDERFSTAIDVRLVEVDVVVTDENGQPVYGLSAADFELLEDGKPVAIRHLDAPAPPPTTESGATSNPTPRETETPSVVIFLQVDSLDAVARKSLGGALAEILADPGREGAYRTMLVTYDDAMEIQTPLTDEPVALRETLARIEQGKLGRAPTVEPRTRVMREIARVRTALSGSHAAAVADRDAVVTEIVAVSQSISAEVRQVLDAMSRLTAGLGAVDGRKILLYVGNSLELSPGRELFDEAERSLGLVGRDRAALRVESNAANTRASFDALLAEANANGVTLYTLVPPNRRVADDVTGTGAASSGFAGRGGGSRTEATKDAACLLSAQTGGLCQVGAAEPEGLLESVRRDLATSYTLAFEPPHPPDGAKHELEVRLREPGRAAALRYRSGFTDDAPEARARDQLAAALFFGVESNVLDVTVDFGAAVDTGSGDLRLVPIELRVPVSGLGVQPLSGGERYGVDARLLLATRDAAGVATGLQEYPIAFQVDRARLESGRPLTYAHTIHLTLPAGEHEVALGLWDAIGTTGSFVTRRIQF